MTPSSPGADTRVWIWLKETTTSEKLLTANDVRIRLFCGAGSITLGLPDDFEYHQTLGVKPDTLTSITFNIPNVNELQRMYPDEECSAGDDVELFIQTTKS